MEATTAGRRWRAVGLGLAACLVGLVGALVAPVALPVMLLALGVVAARRQPRRSALAVAGLSIAIFVPLALIWLVVLLSATVGGECEYEEVRCSGAGEFLSDYGFLGFIPLLPIAIVTAYAFVRGRSWDRGKP